jgi:hypothetical protein
MKLLTLEEQKRRNRHEEIYVLGIKNSKPGQGFCADLDMMMRMMSIWLSRVLHG